MKVESIEMGRLKDHPENPNEMSGERMKMLRGHIARHGYYEPLVVRRHPGGNGDYEILSGHHRRRVLEGLGHEKADCVVWDVGDDEARVLLATLNRLRGADAAQRRAALLGKLAQRYSIEEMMDQLPERRKELERVLSRRKPVRVVGPERLNEMPEAMSFFVRRDQKRVIELAIRQVRNETAGDDPEQKMGRGDLLAVLAAGYLRIKEVHVERSDDAK